MTLPEQDFRRSFSSVGSPIRFNVRLGLIGHEIRREGYDWHGLRRGNKPILLWQYTLSGRGALEFEGRRMNVLPGQAMLLHIPHDHRYFLPPDSEEWRFIFVLLTGVESVRIGRELIERAGPLLDYRERHEARAGALGIFEEMLETGNDPATHSLLGYRLLAATAGFAVGDGAGRTPVIERAIRYCLKHFTEPISVADISDAVDLSRYHFSRRFTREIGSTPAEFILRLRLEKAELLLRSSDLSIRQIGEECGFSTHSYFCRAFRRKFGHAPHAVRES